jgi:uncharacterized protein
MTTRSEHDTSHFEAIPESRCKELLAAHTAGRVGWSAPDGPVILPVTYSYYNTQIVFRTSPHGALSSLERRTRVAFEIDEVDEQGMSGWNVLVRGTAQGVTNRYNLTSLWKDGPVPWAAGVRTLFIAITPERITGRAVRAAFVD